MITHNTDATGVYSYHIHPTTTSNILVLIPNIALAASAP